MENRYYRILEIPLKISSNAPNILRSLDKVYCSFQRETNVTKPLLELIVHAKNGDCLDLSDLEINAITPPSFDGWALSSEVWCGTNILNKYVFKIDNPPAGIKLSKEKQLWEIRTRINPPGIKAGWLLQLHFHINLFVLDHLKSLHVIHGGALEWNGQGLILTGISGSGKSTLTYALAKAGLRFLTDESILIDIAAHRLLPYPVSPSFDESGRHLFKEVRDSFEEDKKLGNKSIKCFVNIKKLGISASVEPVAPEVIIFPKYMPGKKPAIKALSKSQAAEYLRESIMTFQRPEDRKISKIQAVESLVKRCECYELVSNQLEKTVELAKEVLSNP